MFLFPDFSIVLKTDKAFLMITYEIQCASQDIGWLRKRCWIIIGTKKRCAKKFWRDFQFTQRRKKKYQLCSLWRVCNYIPCSMYILLEVGQGILKILSKKICLTSFCKQSGTHLILRIIKCMWKNDIISQYYCRYLVIRYYVHIINIHSF